MHRAFRAGAPAMPDFHIGVARAYEHHELGGVPVGLAAGCDHQHRVGLDEAAEVFEVAVLTKAIVRVARAHDLARSRHDGHAIAADALHQVAAAAGVFLEAGGRRFHDVLSADRSEEHTSELQSLMRISYAVFCLNKKNKLTY